MPGMKRKWLRNGLYGLLLFVLLIPLDTTFQYLNGNARLKYTGLPEPEFYNIDREFRCPNSTSGCLTLGYEWFTQGLSNTTLRCLIRTFGFQEGSYTGEYPTEAEVVQLLKNAGRRVKLLDKSIAIHVEGLGEVLEIDPFETANEFLKSEFYNNVEPNGQLKGLGMLHKDFILLTIEEHPSDTTRQYYYLMDARNEWTFAVYDRRSPF